MTDRRKRKIQIGRRKTDVPIQVLENFKTEMMKHVEGVIDLSIEKNVNGKIKAFREEQQEANKEIKTHLEKQDVAIGLLSDKIEPLDKTKNWFGGLGRGIIKGGAICLAIIAIIKFLQLIGILK